ncbi:hypothetical protein LOC68_10330 [Blastopirellula sp. JC732]|uniref:Uncharacterized protein n=1 Tax=Blastopirellula sediminis TaxID=2894196 RepID=A0A9X1SF63_9BACT|nr:hypothetical protein [Blastopirellula sediminis]MCC9608428.1 hypothetical protein [Blastopirellula sediminis]MCC9628795.1 hypothetical protein [Blastopirellula sediminis]
MQTESTNPVILRFDPGTARAIAEYDCAAAASEAPEALSRDARPATKESVVQVINQNGDTSRLVVVRVDAPEQTYLVLRQQDWADGIGWYTQRSVEIGSDQLGPLRCTLQSCQDCQTAPPQQASRTRKQFSAARRQQLRIVS